MIDPGHARTFDVSRFNSMFFHHLFGVGQTGTFSDTAIVSRDRRDIPLKVCPDVPADCVKA